MSEIFSHFIQHFDRYFKSCLTKRLLMFWTVESFEGEEHPVQGENAAETALGEKGRTDRYDLLFSERFTPFIY